MRRRLLITLGIAAVTALLALALLPWWAAPVIKRIANRYGTKIGWYERVGYAHFAAHDVTFVRGNVAVRVARVETETPLLWAYHHAFGQPAAIVATDWRVDVTPAPTTPTPESKPSSAGGAMPLRATLFKVAKILDRWVPSATVGAGVVTWKGGELRIDRAEWAQRSLAVRPLRYRDQGAEVKATFAKNDELSIAARSVTGLPWQVALKSVRDEIAGDVRVWEQVAPVTAQFSPSGWLPRTLDLRADHWTVAASELKLAPSYTSIRGDARLDWRDGRFEASAILTGDVAPKQKAPPLAANLHARGDAETVTVDSLVVDVPGVKAQLSAPATFSRKAESTSPADSVSHFDVSLDLEKQPWIPDAKGRIEGRAQLVRLPGKVPHLEGEFQAENVSVSRWSAARLHANAALDWPLLRVSEARVGFAEGGQLEGRFEWDLRAKEILAVRAEGIVRRSVVAPWLPEKIQFDFVKLAVTAHGPVAALQHEGTAQLEGFAMPPLHTLNAEMAWKGEGAVVAFSAADVQAGASHLTFAGTVDPQGARLSEFRWEQNGAEHLSLAQPVDLKWQPQLEVSALQLRGPEAAASFAGSFARNAGNATIALKNFPSEWLADFVALPGPAWRVSTFEGQGAWKEGPAEFSVHGGVRVALAAERFANLTLAAQTDARGLKIEALRAAEGDAAIVDATGQLPLTLHPSGPEFLQWEKGVPLALHANTTSNPDFWKRLTEATGLEFQEPEVSIDLAGTWEKPQGTLTAKARRVAADPARIKFSFPAVAALDIQASADGTGIAVDRLAVEVEGQSVRASGKLPLTLKNWPEFKRAPVDFLRREGDLRLEIPDAEIAAFSRYTGQYLAPAGRLHVDLTLQRGGELHGALQLRDAATRPLGPLGVLQELQADALLVGRSIEIKSVTARGGGQPVTLSGKIQVPVGAAPKFALALVGENFPLVRQTGLLMRADLDLKLTTEADNATIVSGAVRLRDSMFLSDVRALIPKGGGGGPSRRPPFFSIENPPLNAWRLAVDVRGEEFLRLRSTVFVGVASARFHLGGTLGEPRATGEAVVDTGQVLLPFATFRVEQGTVRLTEADPYALQLFLAGTSRRYGYDLRMEITGTAGDPLVTFSSSPPLEAKQVLLMVTAGELPQNEVTYGGAQRAARLGTYLGQSLINNFGGDATDADRLSITTGERVSRQGRETYNIQYQLNDRFTVVGEYDEFDAYNAGLKWRLFAPEKTPAQKAAATRAPEKKEAANESPR